MEYIKDVAFSLMLALACTILASILIARKEYILGVVSGLLQKAETAVQGSGMSAEKKALFIAQLEAMANRRREGWAVSCGNKKI